MVKFYNTIDSIGSVDDTIEKNEEIIDKIYSFLTNKFNELVYGKNTISFGDLKYWSIVIFWYNENKDDYILSQMYNYYKKYRTRPVLKKLDLSTWNTSNVTDMTHMFKECDSLQNLDLSNFDTSNVKYMSDMFYQCMSLSKLNISSFDTSNVTSMGRMFTRCASLKKLDLSHFNIQNVDDMRWMFADCTQLRYLNLYNWIFIGHVDIHEMFKDTKNIRDLRLSKSAVLKFIGYDNDVALKVL